MGFLNTGYISKALFGTKLRKLVLFSLVFLVIVVAFFYLFNKPTVALYRFNSGLNLNFDLNKWRLLPNSTSGDILEKNTQDISIYLTTARPEDSSKSLIDIVDSRISQLNKENIQVTKEPIKINNLDFYKIEYKDKGDENVKPDERSISYVTLYNGTYTAIQIFYKVGSNLNDVIDIVGTIKAN